MVYAVHFFFLLSLCYSLLKRGHALRRIPFSHQKLNQELAKFSGTVADNHIDDDGFLAEFGLVFGLDDFHEVVIQFFADEVDGAAAESAAHDA